MDTVFKIITLDDEVYIKADHFGYENKIFHATYILSKLFRRTGIEMDSLNYLMETFEEIDGDNIQDIEVVMDKVEETIIFDLGLDIQKVSSDQDNIKHVEYKNIQALLNNKMTFEEFDDFYAFFKTIQKEKQVIINDTYLYQLHTK